MSEEYGRETISNAHGFVTYAVHGTECMIYDLYIAPQFRRERHGIKLCNEVFDEARRRKCTHCTCLVDTRHKKGTKLCSTYIEYGFEIIDANNAQLVMAKEL